MKRFLFLILVLLFASSLHAQWQEARMSLPFVAGSVAAAGGACTWYDCVVYTPNGALSDGATRNWRNIIPANTCADSGTKIRITVKGGVAGAGANIQASTIGIMTSGDVFDAAPTAIKWDSGSASTTVAQDTEKVSDDTTYTLTKTNRHGIHIYTTDRDFAIMTSGAGGLYYDATASDESATLDPATSEAAGEGIVIKLEVCK